MSLIKRMLSNKDKIEQFIMEKGIKEAVKIYSVKKLVKDGFLTLIKNTELYSDYNLSFTPSVFDKNGNYLGHTTMLMGPFYKKIGGAEAACLNGDIILSCKSIEDAGLPSQSYGVFDKQGNQLVEYGKYFTHEFLPEGVVLMNGHAGELVNAVKIGYNGAITYQDYFKIEEYFPTGDLKGKKMYKIYKKLGDRVVHELVDYYPDHNYPPFEE